MRTVVVQRKWVSIGRNNEIKEYLNGLAQDDPERPNDIKNKSFSSLSAPHIWDSYCFPLHGRFRGRRRDTAEPTRVARLSPAIVDVFPSVTNSAVLPAPPVSMAHHLISFAVGNAAKMAAAGFNGFLHFRAHEVFGS
jgi:hypothetical protein